MPKFIATLIVAIVLPLSFAGCSSDDSTPAQAKPAAADVSITDATQAVAPETTNLDGHWAFAGDQVGFSAVVKDNHIDIQLTLGDQTGLYWTGSFESEPAGEKVVSETTKADVDAMYRSLFGESLKTDSKEFVVTEDTITFDFTMMGTTRTVEMTR